MRVLKKKYRKNYKPTIKPIKIQPKLGRWCEYYEGRLPYPIECSTNKGMPKSQIFKGNKIITIRDTSNCVNCKRSVEWESWKKGSWDRVKKAIAQSEDLTDVQESFNIKE